ncbi:uncharacterized protein LOC144105592 [Amblyomma americanum]
MGTPSEAVDYQNSALASGDQLQPTTSTGNVPAAKRLQQELMALVTNGPKGISAFPDGDSLFRWIATIRGPEGTVFEGTDYRLSLEFSGLYPFQPPKDKWTPLLDVRSVLLSIQSLLAEPNISSALNSEAAQLWNDKELYKSARELFEAASSEDNAS